MAPNKGHLNTLRLGFTYCYYTITLVAFPVTVTVRERVGGLGLPSIPCLLQSTIIVGVNQAAFNRILRRCITDYLYNEGIWVFRSSYLTSLLQGWIRRLGDRCGIYCRVNDRIGPWFCLLISWMKQICLVTGLRSWLRVWCSVLDLHCS